jgi:CheY-like chemotaxis protein
MTVKQRKILIADDDVDDQDILKEAIVLLDNTLQIDTVDNGQEVLNYLSDCPETEFPSLIILDYKMPFLNAAEVLEKLAGNHRFSGIPKVVWSTSKHQDDANRCMRAGAKQYFIKPTQASQLKIIAMDMLEKSDKN